MLNKTCDAFIAELGSSAPVPGGGSAAALVGAVGAALGTMVGELTRGKKTYARYEAEIIELIADSRRVTEKMKASVQRDVEAFRPLAEAYRMPAATEEEKAAKQKAVQASLYGAAAAPLELAELCVEALRLLDRYSQVGSRLAISDVGTGSAMCLAALKGARLNVLANTSAMTDLTLKKELEERIAKATADGQRISDATYACVEKKLIG